MKISAINLKKVLSSLFITSILVAGFLSCSSSPNSDKQLIDESGPVPTVELEAFVPGATSVEMAANMSIGWNLGNTLDAHYTGATGLDTETSWGMPKTTEAMITAVHNAGFKTIRIPVSWHNHVSGNDYTIDTAWMNRVKTVVDWAYSKDMCVIINVHHDNFTESELANNSGFALPLSNETVKSKSKAYLTAVWTQIANKFKDYDNKLVFEVLNEPRAIGTQYEWDIQDAKIAKSYCDIITEYENTCISVIRNTGGNNSNRYIMVPGYAASGTGVVMLDAYTLPTDTASDKLLVSTHAYAPYKFAMSDKTDSTFGADDKGTLDYHFNYLKNKYTSNGIGVVMGEASASDKSNTAERVKWATYYFTKAKEAGISVVLWDNMVTVASGGDIDSGECHGYYNRKSNSWYFPSIIEAMMKAVYGDNYTAE